MISGHVHELLTLHPRREDVPGNWGRRSTEQGLHGLAARFDECFDGPPSAVFTLLLTPLSTRLEIEMRGLQQRHGGFETLDYLAIPWVSRPM